MFFRQSRRTRVQQAFRLRADGLGVRVVRGASYQVIGMLVRTATTIGSVSILARLLTPADFGLIAMATVVTEFAALFSNFGLSNILIQRRGITRLQLDTVFWTSAGIGVVLAVFVFVMSFVSNLLYGEAIVGPLLRLLAVTFLLGPLVTVPWAILSRLMHFRAQFVVSAASKISSAMIAIALAYAGYGVWSLALGAVAGSVINVASTYLAVPYMPRFRFDMPYLRASWRTSGSYFGSGMLYFVNSNVDLFLIGRFLGPASLGFYQNARSLTNEIRARVAMPLQHVLFPAFSSLQHDPQRSREFVMRSARMIAAVVVPIGLGVSATAPELVPVLYGEQWTAMIPVISMFGLSAALSASTAIASPLFNSQNRVALALRYNLIGAMLTIGAITASLSAGINAVASALALTSLYMLIVMHAAFRLIGLGVRDVSQVLGAPFISAGSMWALIHLVRPHIVGFFGAHAVPALALHVALGASVYVVLLLLLSRSYLLEAQAVFRKAVQVFVH